MQVSTHAKLTRNTQGLSGIARKTLACALALMLCAPLCTWHASVAVADTGARSQAKANAINAQVESLLAAAPYEEGSVIAVVTADFDDGAYRSGSDSGLSALSAGTTAVEELSSVSGSVVREVVADAASTGTAGAAAKEDAAEGLALSALSAANSSDALRIVCVSNGMSTEELLTMLLADENVISAEPNYLYELPDEEEDSATSASDTAAAIATDTADAATDAAGTATTAAASSSSSSTASASVADATAYQWYYENDGTIGNTAGHTVAEGFDMAPTNWNAYDEDGAPVENAYGYVAVIDSGVDITNPDLANVIATDMLTYNTEGGANGYTPNGDDPAAVMPTTSNHGTHVAGIVGAEWNNFGVSGAASGIKIVPIRAMANNGQFSTYNLVKSYNYLKVAMDNGLHLVATNNSYSGVKNSSYALDICVRELGYRGCVSVFASANTRADTDKETYTATWLKNNPYAIIVNSATVNGWASSFSNYGQTTTNVFAGGSGILSTNARNVSEAYVGETDANPLASIADPANYTVAGESGTVHKILYGTRQEETFTTVDEEGFETQETLTVPAQNLEELTCAGFTYAAASETTYGADDNACASVTPTAQNSNASLTQTVIDMYIPVLTSQVSDVQNISLKYTSSGKTGINLWVGVNNTTYDKAVFEPLSLGALEIADAYVWSSCGSSCTAALSAGGEGSSIASIDCGDGVSYVAVEVQIVPSSGGQPLIEGETFSVDNIVLGDANANHDYFYCSGTSMAAPAVAGCAAIIAKEQNDDEAIFGEGVDTAAKALERANLIQARVIDMPEQEDASGLCMQGGLVNMAVDQAEYTPVINAVDASTAGAITITGAYFGKALRSVSVDGVACEITAANEASVTVAATALAGGQHTLVLTAENGKSCTASFVSSAVDESAGTARPCFEEEIAFPGEDYAVSPSQAQMIGLGGKLYLLMGDDYVSEQAPLGRFMSYDPAYGTWTKLNDLPAFYVDAHLALYEGAIYAYCTNSSGAPAVYRYNAAANTWSTLSLDYGDATLFEMRYGTVGNVGGTLYLFGAYAKPGSQGAGSIWEIRLEGDSATLCRRGSLAASSVHMTFTERDGKAYVMTSTGSVNEVTFNEKGAASASLIGEAPTLTDTSGALALTGETPCITNVADGLLIGPAYLLASNDACYEDEDVYLIPAGEDGNLQPWRAYDKRGYAGVVRTGTLFAYDGRVYLLGFSTDESPNLVIRATAAETLPYSGDVARGDVNANGTVNIVDAQIAYDIAHDEYASDKFADMRFRANVNGDTVVDAQDARAIQYAALCGSWE